MAAYLVGQIKVKDPAQWEVYVAGVRQTLLPFEAEVLFRGRLASVLAGQLDRDLVVVIRFADLDLLQRWHRSPAYQALVPIRDRAAEVVIAVYEEGG